MMKTKILSNRILFYKIIRVTDIIEDNKFYSFYLKKKQNREKLSACIRESNFDLMTLSIDIDDFIDECNFKKLSLTGILTGNTAVFRLSELKRYSSFSTMNIKSHNLSHEYLYTYRDKSIKRLSKYK